MRLTPFAARATSPSSNEVWVLRDLLKFGPVSPLEFQRSTADRYALAQLIRRKLVGRCSCGHSECFGSPTMAAACKKHDPALHGKTLVGLTAKGRAAATALPPLPTSVRMEGPPLRDGARSSRRRNRANVETGVIGNVQTFLSTVRARPGDNRPHVTLRDGTVLSIQASRFHRSKPQKDTGPHTHYTHVEVYAAKPLKGLGGTIEPGYGVGGWIHSYVPVPALNSLIKRHGGIRSIGGH